MSTEVRFETSGQIGRITFQSDSGINLLSVPVMAAVEARLANHVLCAHEAAWLEKGFAGEAECFGKAFRGEESREGLKAFLEKRQPSWAGAV